MNLPAINYPKVLLCVTAILLVIGVMREGININSHTKAEQPATQSGYVSFNPIKFQNAQRQYLSSVINSTDGSINTDSVLTFREIEKMGKSSKAAIREIAGPDAVVLIEQSLMLNDNVPDITDAVLESLGLPTDVSPSYGFDLVKNQSALPRGRQDFTPKYLQTEPFSETITNQLRSESYDPTRGRMP